MSGTSRSGRRRIDHACSAGGLEPSCCVELAEHRLSARVATGSQAPDPTDGRTRDGLGSVARRCLLLQVTGSLAWANLEHNPHITFTWKAGRRRHPRGHRRGETDQDVISLLSGHLTTTVPLDLDPDAPATWYEVRQWSRRLDRGRLRSRLRCDLPRYGHPVALPVLAPA